MGKRFVIPFSKIVTPKFVKLEAWPECVRYVPSRTGDPPFPRNDFELRTHRCDIRKILTDHPIASGGTMGRYGEFEVNVSRTAVLAKLKENRDKYAAIYEKAVQVYRKKVEEWLAKQLDLLRADEPFSLHCVFQAPANHLQDYDDVIALLEDSVDETLVMNEGQHASYMRNRWDWMHAAKMSLCAYSCDSGPTGPQGPCGENGPMGPTVAEVEAL